jgi:hypothetical protein
MNEITTPEPLINPDEVTEVIVLPLTPIEPCQDTASERKPFAKFTAVVNGLQTIDGIDTAMAYAKFYFDNDQSIEENISNITDIIEQDL